MKITRTKSGFTIITAKMFGHFINVSFGQCAKPAATKALPTYDQMILARNRANKVALAKYGFGNLNLTDDSIKFWQKEYNRALRTL